MATVTPIGMSAIRPAISNPYELTKSELEELGRLEREHIEREARILRERSELSEKAAEARGKLEQARKRQADASLALASGGKGDVLGCADEIKRIESLIDGYEQIYAVKSAELRAPSQRFVQLAQKKASFDEFAEITRLNEEVRIAEEKLQSARESIPVLERAAILARDARASRNRGF